MAIDCAEVRRIARLAHIDLDEATIVALTRQLQSILDYVAVLNSLDLEAVPPTSHPLESEPRMRDDEERPSLTTAEALANAPRAEAGHFRVPRMLDE